MLELKNISKIIDDRVILNDISIVFPHSGFIGIKGKSGSGKSSLLYILSLLDEDFLGSLFFNGESIEDVYEYRKTHVSYMMQNNDYVDALTVKENIILSSHVADMYYSKTKLNEIVKRVGIQDLLDRYPRTLSGGQLKRMSIAKALLKEAEIILCDEPTGALFDCQSHETMQLLKEVSKEKLVIIVSHDEKLLDEYCDCVLTLENGKVLGQLDCQSDKDIQRREEKKSNLFFYVYRQMLKQKYKYSVFVMFQWLLVCVFLLVLSGLNGVVSTIYDIKESDVYKNMIVIENKDHSAFENIISGYKLVDYSYNLEFLECKNDKNQNIDSFIRFLPENKEHIKLISGNLPVNENEVLVSEKLYNMLNSNEIILYCDDFSYRVYISGVVKSDIFGDCSIYLSKYMKEQLNFLKDTYALTIESSNVKEDYAKLLQEYYATSDVFDQSENYETLLAYGKMIVFICVFMSLCVSLILYSIVSSIVLEERIHDLCYLKTLGLDSKRIYKLTLIENIVLAFIIVAGGILFFEICFYYMNHVFDMYNQFYFSLERYVVLIGKYDIYIIIFVLYAGLCCLTNRKTFIHIQNLNVIEVLREE